MELFPTGQSSAPPKEGEYSKDQLDAIKTEHQSKYKTISNWEQLEDLDIVDAKTDPHGNGTYQIRKWYGLFVSKSPKDRIMARKELLKVIEILGAQAWMTDKVMEGFITKDAKGKYKCVEDKANSEAIKIFSALLDVHEPSVPIEKSKLLAKMFSNALTSPAAAGVLKKMVEKKMMGFADLLSPDMLSKHTRKAKANAFKYLVNSCLESPLLEKEDSAQLQLSQLCVTMIKDKILDVKKAGHEGLAKIGVNFGEERLEELWKSATQKEPDSFQKNWKHVSTELAKANKGKPKNSVKTPIGPPDFKWADVLKEIVKEHSKTVLVLLTSDEQPDKESSEEVKDCLVSALMYIAEKLSKCAIKRFECCENLLHTVENFFAWASQPQKLLKDASRRRETKAGMHGTIILTFGKTPKIAVNACAQLSDVLINKMFENKALNDKANSFGSTIAKNLIELSPVRHEPEAACHYSMVLLSKLCKKNIIQIENAKKIFEDAGTRDFGAVVFMKEHLKDESAVEAIDEKYIKLISKAITNQMLAKKHKTTVTNEIIFVLSGLASSNSKGRAALKAIEECDKSKTVISKLNVERVGTSKDSEQNLNEVKKSGVSIAKDVDNTMRKLKDLAKMDNVNTGIANLTNCISKKVRNQHGARTGSSKPKSPVIADFDTDIFGVLVKVLKATVKNNIVHKNCLICFGALVSVLGSEAETEVKKHMSEIVKRLNAKEEDTTRKQSYKCIKECTKAIGIENVLPYLTNIPTVTPKKNEEKTKNELILFINEMVELSLKELPAGHTGTVTLVGLVPKIMFCVDSTKRNQKTQRIACDLLMKLSEREGFSKIRKEMKKAETKMKSTEVKNWLRETVGLIRKLDTAYANDDSRFSEEEYQENGGDPAYSGDADKKQINKAKKRKGKPSARERVAAGNSIKQKKEVTDSSAARCKRKTIVSFATEDSREAEKVEALQPKKRKSLRERIVTANATRKCEEKNDAASDRTIQATTPSSSRSNSKYRNGRKSGLGRAQRSDLSQNGLCNTSKTSAQLQILISTESKEIRRDRYLKKRKEGNGSNGLNTDETHGTSSPIYQVENYEDFMQVLLTCVSPLLFEKLTAPSNRSQRHIEAMSMINDFKEIDPDTTVAVSDVLLRWAACKIDDIRTPPSVTLVISEFISSICELLLSSGAELTEYEASVLVLPVARKCGSARESVRKAAYSCLLSISDVLNKPTMLSTLGNGFKSQLDASSCELVAPLISQLIEDHLSMFDSLPDGLVQSLVKAASGSNETVGRAAAFCLLSINVSKRDELWTEVNCASIQDAQVVEERMDQANAFLRETNFQIRSPTVKNPFGVAPKRSTDPFSSHRTPKLMAEPIMMQSNEKTLKDIRMSDFRLSVAPEPSSKVIASIKDILGTHTPARTRHTFGKSHTPKLPDIRKDPFDFKIPKYVDIVAHILEKLASKHRNEQEKALSILYEDTKKKEKSKLRKRPSEVIPALLRCFGDVFRRLLAKCGEKEDSLLLKRFLNAVMAYVSESDPMIPLNRVALQSSIEELVSALVPKEVAGIDDWNQVKRSVKVIIVRLTEVCDENLVFSVLIKLLMISLQDSVNPNSLEEKSKKALKCDCCIKAIAQTVKRGFKTCNIDELLREVHVFLSRNPVLSGTSVISNEQNVTLQLLKTIVDTLIELFGTKIRNYVGLIPGGHQHSQLMLYIESMLSKESNGEHSGLVATSPMSVPSPISVPSPLYGPTEGSRPFMISVPPLALSNSVQSDQFSGTKGLKNTSILTKPRLKEEPQRSPRERFGLPPRDKTTSSSHIKHSSTDQKGLGMSSSGLNYMQRLKQIQQRYKSGVSDNTSSLPASSMPPALIGTPKSEVLSNLRKRVETPKSRGFRLKLEVQSDPESHLESDIAFTPRLQNLREKISKISEKHYLNDSE